MIGLSNSINMFLSKNGEERSPQRIQNDQASWLSSFSISKMSTFSSRDLGKLLFSILRGDLLEAQKVSSSIKSLIDNFIFKPLLVKFLYPESFCELMEKSSTQLASLLIDSCSPHVSLFLSIFCHIVKVRIRFVSLIESAPSASTVGEANWSPIGTVIESHLGIEFLQNADSQLHPKAASSLENSFEAKEKQLKSEEKFSSSKFANEQFPSLEQNQKFQSLNHLSQVKNHSSQSQHFSFQVNNSNNFAANGSNSLLDQLTSKSERLNEEMETKDKQKSSKEDYFSKTDKKNSENIELIRDDKFSGKNKLPLIKLNSDAKLEVKKEKVRGNSRTKESNGSLDLDEFEDIFRFRKEENSSKITTKGVKDDDEESSSIIAEKKYVKEQSSFAQNEDSFTMNSSSVDAKCISTKSFSYQSKISANFSDICRQRIPKESKVKKNYRFLPYPNAPDHQGDSQFQNNLILQNGSQEPSLHDSKHASQQGNLINKKFRDKVLFEAQDYKRGVIKFYNHEKEYGFIISGSNEYFLHKDDLIKAGIEFSHLQTPTMLQQKKVHFRVIQYQGKSKVGLKAIDIKLQ